MHSSLKQIPRSALLAVLLLGMAALPAQAQLGVTGGLNFNSASDIETTANPDDNATFDNATGYHLGLVYDIGTGPLNLRPGILYRKVGTYEFPNSRYDVTAIEVPVDLRLTVIPTPVVSAYVLGGPNVIFPQSENEFEDEMEEVSFTFNVGVGADVELPGAGLTLQPEFRYEFGATDYVDDDFDIGGTTFQPTERKLSAFALRLNVLF